MNALVGIRDAFHPSSLCPHPRPRSRRRPPLRKDAAASARSVEASWFARAATGRIISRRVRAERLPQAVRDRIGLHWPFGPTSVAGEAWGPVPVVEEVAARARGSATHRHQHLPGAGVTSRSNEIRRSPSKHPVDTFTISPVTQVAAGVRFSGVSWCR
jgi:hypothetical protein